MGLFEYESGLMFVNLTDSWIMLLILIGIYIILWLAVKTSQSCKGNKYLGKIN